MAVLETVPENIDRTSHKTVVILFIAQSLTAAGVIATAKVPSILGKHLSVRATWAGMPSAIIQLADAQ
jgi:hypothetical protein